MSGVRRAFAGRLPGLFATAEPLFEGMADPSTGQRSDTHARTDRRSAGRQVRTSPESLYLWQIAVLQTRIERLQGSVEQHEQELQRVIDRYEHVLDERARDGELLTDGGTSVSADHEPSRTGIRGALDRLQSLLE